MNTGRTSPTATGRHGERRSTSTGRARTRSAPTSSQNARQWFEDFHIDGLRLDAVHEIIDRNATTFLEQLAREASELRESTFSPCWLIAESADNDPRLVTARAAGGIGLDAQWNDDFHHALHAAVTGEDSGYYLDYGSVEDIARAMSDGFVYQGEHSRFKERRHGAPSAALAPERFVIFAQNHDQIGNRPRGDRLVTIDLAGAGSPRRGARLVGARCPNAVHGRGVRRNGAVPLLHRPRGP